MMYQPLTHERVTWFIATVALILVVLFTVPLLGTHWGTVSLQPSNTITVSGIARAEESNNLAVYSAGVNATNENKDAAVSQVNTEVEKIIQSLNSFGIASADIKTQNLSVYKIEEPIFRGDSLVAPTGKSVWQANNNLEIKLRDTTRASELAQLLTDSGATNVYGPTFQLDDSNNPEDALMSEAIDHARQKAVSIAESSGGRLGAVLSVVEGNSSGSVFPYAVMESARGAGGATPVEPGTSGVSKTVTVTFELRPSSRLPFRMPIIK